MTNAIVSFSYNSFAPEVATQLRQTAEAIRQSGRRQVEEVIASGRALINAKAALAHGQFGPWLTAEFAWTEKTAQNYMRAAEAFGSNPKRVSGLPVATVYRLASVSQEIRDEVLARVEQDTSSSNENVPAIISAVLIEHKERTAEARRTLEERKAKAEREKRRLAAHRKREAAWEAERDARREKEEASARAALVLVREYMPERYIEFLTLAQASHEHLPSVVHKELVDRKPPFPRPGSEGGQ